ncbi:hypothetical protein GGU10DRAFT_350982 [Lentinula aff. detonsa]|uniref:DUF4246 domain-containing protein n=1 Tax=Lentinula aff. detonsa TaxID=2804958 RepID=A0AA38NPU3_9AGAR|nr:hypothetical protein GGU10DRAFT_350982 [Lentinula aff. detonsa]
MAAIRDGRSGYRHPFIVGTYFLGGVGDNPRTLVDLAMSQFSWSIRSHSNWWQLCQTQSVRHDWAEDAIKKDWEVTTSSSTVIVQLSERQIFYVLNELQGYALLRDQTHHCQVSCFERIWDSDRILSPAPLSALNDAFSVLRTKKRFTESDSTMAIVDPTLHPLVYRHTLVSSPLLRTWPPPQLTDIYTLSQKYALLPSDVSISPFGEVEFISYINDIDPQLYKTTYLLLKNALTSFIPLFEHTLTDLHRNNPLQQRIPGTCRYTIWEEPDAPEHSDDEEGWVEYEREMRDWSLNRPINLPDVPLTGYPGGLERRRYEVSLKSKRLQFIVNVSEYCTISGQTEFTGTPWHVEGMMNERIVACGFLFTAVDNVRSCDVQFRMAISYPRGFHAGDTGATLRTWGFKDGDSCHQYIGSIPIRQGLAVVFPNIYQHKFTPITLGDISRPGKITVLSFLLVDPDILPIISTANVAPQQKAWIQKVLDDCLHPRLPTEIVEKIVDMVDGLMDEQESQGHSEKLRNERDRFRKMNDNYHFCIPFDIWNGPEMM